MSAAGQQPFTYKGGDLVLRIRAYPNAGRDRAAGLAEASDGRVSLKVHVKALAEKGKANAAVIATVAKALGIAKSDLTLRRGGTGREKTLAISKGRGRLEARIEALCAAERT